MSTDTVVRLGEARDVPQIADVIWTARAGAGDAFPPSVHPREDLPRWVGTWDLASVWVAEREGTVVGVAYFPGDWLDSLYVAPEAQGLGVGSMLLAATQQVRPEGFALWVFETNHGAREFYRRHGLVELERTPGDANEERAPDVRVAWAGVNPGAFWTRQLERAESAARDAVAHRDAVRARHDAQLESGG